MHVVTPSVPKAKKTEVAVPSWSGPQEWQYVHSQISSHEVGHFPSHNIPDPKDECFRPRPIGGISSGQETDWDSLLACTSSFPHLKPASVLTEHECYADQPTPPNDPLSDDQPLRWSRLWRVTRIYPESILHSTDDWAPMSARETKCMALNGSSS